MTVRLKDNSKRRREVLKHTYDFPKGVSSQAPMLPAFASELRKYVRERILQSRTDRRANAGLQVYWRVLPVWLARNWLSRDRNGAQKRFLRDIMRGQVLLYHAIRIQDDLFDGQQKSLSLLYVADQFLLMAEAVYAKHLVKDSKFWNVYRGYLGRTIQSILEVDNLERSPNSDPEVLLNLHGKVCSIFKIASAAVCAKANRWTQFHRIERFSDEMAKAGQIIDDLIDIQEDLRRKRFNYAANIVYHAATARNRKKSLPTQSVKQLTVDGLGLVFRKIYHHLDAAGLAIKPLKVPEADPYLYAYKELVVRMQFDLVMRPARVAWCTREISRAKRDGGHLASQRGHPRRDNQG